jgi:hypothetical protein
LKVFYIVECGYCNYSFDTADFIDGVDENAKLAGMGLCRFDDHKFLTLFKRHFCNIIDRSQANGGIAIWGRLMMSRTENDVISRSGVA